MEKKRCEDTANEEECIQAKRNESAKAPTAGEASEPKENGKAEQLQIDVKAAVKDVGGCACATRDPNK